MRLSLRFTFFFACRCPIAVVLFVETAILPPLNCFNSFTKNQLSIFVWFYFWDLYYMLSVCVSIALPVLYNLNYWSNYLITSNWLDWFLPLYFFSIVLVFLVLLPFLINFRKSLSMSTKNLAELLIEIVLSLNINFRRITLLTMFNLLIHECSMSLHLFRFSLKSFTSIVEFPPYKSYICFVRFTSISFFLEWL